MTTMTDNDGVVDTKDTDKDVTVLGLVSANMKPDEVQRYLDIAQTRLAKYGLLPTAQNDEPLAAKAIQLLDNDQLWPDPVIAMKSSIVNSSPRRPAQRAAAGRFRAARWSIRGCAGIFLCQGAI